MVSDCWQRSQWLHQPEGAKTGPAQLQQLRIQWWNLHDDDQSVPLTPLQSWFLLNSVVEWMTFIKHINSECGWMSELSDNIDSRYWKNIKSLYVLQICSTRPKLDALMYTDSLLSGCFCSSGGWYSSSLTVTAQVPSTATSCIKVILFMFLYSLGWNIRQYTFSKLSKTFLLKHINAVLRSAKLYRFCVVTLRSMLLSLKIQQRCLLSKSSQKNGGKSNRNGDKLLNEILKNRCPQTFGSRVYYVYEAQTSSCKIQTGALGICRSSVEPWCVRV